MGLFRRGDKDETELAKAIAKRGLPAEATITGMRPTGAIRADGVAKEFEFELAFNAANGQPVHAVARQFMDDVTLTGLAPGEPAAILYDRTEPERLIVQQSPKYVFVRNPNMAFDGKRVVAVPVAEAGERGLSPD